MKSSSFQLIYLSRVKKSTKNSGVLYALQEGVPKIPEIDLWYAELQMGIWKKFTAFN